MDIPALSMAMAQSQFKTDVGVAMLSKAIDFSSDIGDGLTAMIDSAAAMQHSVTPHLGGSIDLSV